jgi:hypothetical protein
VIRLIDFCWSCFKGLLALAVIGAALAVPYYYLRIDDEIRLHVQKKIAQHYAGLRVSVRTAALVQGEGIQMRGLSIIEPGAEGPGAELLTYDECLLSCATDLKQLVSGHEPDVKRVTIRRPVLRVTRRPNGTWSAAKLLPLPRFGIHPPEVVVENGTVEILDPLHTPCSTVTLRDVNLRLLAPAAGATGDDARRRVEGSFSSDHFRQVLVAGWLDPHAPAFHLQGSTEGLEISPEMRAALPQPLAEQLVCLGSLRGQGELSFNIAYEPTAAAPWQFDVRGRLLRGRLDDPRLPHPLTDMRAVVRLNNQGLHVDDLYARSNQATLHLTCHMTGYAAAATKHVELEIHQLELDRQLYDALPPPLQDQWYKYQPRGQADVTASLDYDGRAWKPEVRIDCQDASFTNYKFDYRLEHVRGALQLKDDRLAVNLVAYGERQPVRIDGVVWHPTNGPYGWMEAKGEEVQLDTKLMAALPERSRKVARDLDLHGTVDFNWRMWRDSPSEPFHRHLWLSTKRCWMRYEHFRYSLQDIRGTVEMSDGRWVVQGLEGGNGTARVTCEGGLTPTPAGNELVLRFRAVNVPLEDELRDAMPPAMRQVWKELKPRGIVDLTAEMRYLDTTRQLNLAVRAEPRSETASLEPLHFPYRLDKVRAVLDYRNGQAHIERLRAEHGPVKVAAEGFCRFLPDGGWHVRLQGLTVDRVRADRDLMQAVPAQLKKALVELNPSGPMDIRGTFELARGPNLGEPVRSQWDLAVGMQQLSLGGDLRLENVCGGLTLVGGFDGQRFHSRGELSLDSLTYKDVQFTQIMGPLWVDDTRLLLGGWAQQHQDGLIERVALEKQPARSVSARLFGGTIYGDAWITTGAQPHYGLRAALSDGSLARCALETAGMRARYQGRLLGNIDLHGQGRSREGLSGRGSVALREADLYELPMVLAMLKLLSIRPPDQKAFSKSDADFRIQGEHIYFDKLDFTGDAISLLGKGEMNFQQELHLTFTAIVGRGELGIPALRTLFTGASEQLIQIHVGGTLQNPDTTKEAFPGVSQALQQLQNGLEGK